MTDTTFIFDEYTRSVTAEKRGSAYCGQQFDNCATTLYFVYKPEDFLTRENLPSGNRYVPYIQFSLGDGNVYVYGPTSTSKFDGYSFAIPYEITSRMKSMRLEFQLVFVLSNAHWDPAQHKWVDIDSSVDIFSAVAGIALKPSLSNKCKDAKSMTVEPGTLSWIETWKSYGLIRPVESFLVDDPDDEHFGDWVLVFHTYNGEEQYAYLDVATEEGIAAKYVAIHQGEDNARRVMSTDQYGVVAPTLPGTGLEVAADGVLSVTVGGKNGNIPMLGEDIADGGSLIYDAATQRFMTTPAGYLQILRGVCTSAELDAKLETARFGDVWNLKDERSFGGATYPAGTNWVCDLDASETKRWEPLGGNIDLSILVKIADLVKSWDGADVDDTHAPSAKLTHDTLLQKLDVSKVKDATSGSADDDVPSMKLFKKEIVGLIHETDILQTFDPPTDQYKAYSAQLFHPTGLTDVYLHIDATGKLEWATGTSGGSVSRMDTSITGTGSAKNFQFPCAKRPVSVTVYNPDGLMVEVQVKYADGNVTLMFGDYSVPASGAVYPVVITY